MSDEKKTWRHPEVKFKEFINRDDGKQDATVQCDDCQIILKLKDIRVVPGSYKVEKDICEGVTELNWKFEVTEDEG